MKQIGFAKQYYTLWDLTVEPIYTEVRGQYRHSGDKCIRTYHQNLSKDLSKAKQKFEQITGLQAPEPDDELKGKTRSWISTNNFEVYLEGEFNCGKYRGQLISECKDLDYLLWWKDNNNNSSDIVKNRICELDSNYLINEFGDIVTKKQSIIGGVLNQIDEGKIEVTAVSNFNVYEGVYGCVRVIIENPKNEDEKLFMEEYSDYGCNINNIDIDNLNLVQKFYRGYEYWTPKGCRSFKKTKFTLKNNKVILK